MFSEVTGHLPELTGSAFRHRRPYLQSPVLAVGPPDAYDCAVRAFWESSSAKPLVFVVDQNRRVIVSDPNPPANSLGLYGETDSTCYGLVTRMVVPDETPFTFIQGSTPQAISRTMDFLASDDELSSVVMAEVLGGPELKKPVPTIFGSSGYLVVPGARSRPPQWK
jgi:hypothetical protein